MKARYVCLQTNHAKKAFVVVDHLKSLGVQKPTKMKLKPSLLKLHKEWLGRWQASVLIPTTQAEAGENLALVRGGGLQRLPASTPAWVTRTNHTQKKKKKKKEKNLCTGQPVNLGWD